MKKLSLLALLVAASVFAAGCASEDKTEAHGSAVSHLDGDDDDTFGDDDDDGGELEGEEDEPGDLEGDDDDDGLQDASWRDWMNCMEKTSGADCDKALDI